MKRTILAGLALTVVTTFFHIPSAEAQVSSGRNPWCLRDGPLGRGTWDCTYHNYKQCWDSSVFGTDGSCVENPNYRGPRQNRNSGGAQQGPWGWDGRR
jgi:Protein of unknown function (DUF3551)